MLSSGPGGLSSPSLCGRSILQKVIQYIVHAAGVLAGDRRPAAGAAIRHTCYWHGLRLRLHVWLEGLQGGRHRRRVAWHVPHWRPHRPKRQPGVLPHCRRHLLLVRLERQLQALRRVLQAVPRRLQRLMLHRAVLQGQLRLLLRLLPRVALQRWRRMLLWLRLLLLRLLHGLGLLRLLLCVALRQRGGL